jgi:hypothetical protein
VRITTRPVGKIVPMGHSKEVRLLFRGVLALCLATILVGLAWVVPALAETTTTTTSQTGYYTKTQDPTKTTGGAVSGITGGAINPGGVTGSTPGWPRKDNYLYVAKFANQEDSYAFVSLDLSPLPFGAQISGITFEFRVENELETGTAGFDVNTPGLRLCLVTSEWAGGEGGSFDQRPTSDCSVTTGVTLLGEETRNDPTGQPRKVLNYSADLLSMAGNWAADKPNYGFSIQPTEDAPFDYQVAIRTPTGMDPEAMIARLRYESGEDFSSDFFGDVSSPSFGSISGSDFSYSAPETGAFSTAPSPGPEATAAEGGPKTPWWVWSIIPILLGGLALLARIATADVAIARRVGPMTRLLARRASLGRPG